MGPDGIVLLPPLFDKHLRFFDGIKYLAVKHLIPQLAIETIIIPILPLTTWFNIQGPYSDTAQPVTHCFSCKLIMIEGGVINDPAFVYLLCRAVFMKMRAYCL